MKHCLKNALHLQSLYIVDCWCLLRVFMLYAAGGFRYDFLYDHPAITYEVRKAPIPSHSK